MVGKKLGEDRSHFVEVLPRHLRGVTEESQSSNPSKNIQRPR
jgi:hypothetical protein